MTNNKFEKLQWIFTLGSTAKDIFELLSSTHEKLSPDLRKRVEDTLLSSKGMKDNALALESFGVGFLDPTTDELGYFQEALMTAKGKNKKFMENIILVLGWPLPQENSGKEKEEKDKKDNKDPSVPGFTSSSPDLRKVKEEKKKIKYSGRIRALCSGTKSSTEVYSRMDAFGLLDETPGGAIERFFALMKKKLPPPSGSTENGDQKKTAYEKAKEFREEMKQRREAAQARRRARK